MGDKKHVADFLVGLSKDPAKAEAFKNDPDGVMDAHGIAHEDKAVIKTGDHDQIHAHLGEDDPPGCVFVVGLAVI